MQGCFPPAGDGGKAPAGFGAEPHLFPPERSGVFFWRRFRPSKKNDCGHFNAPGHFFFPSRKRRQKKTRGGNKVLFRRSEAKPVKKRSRKAPKGLTATSKKKPQWGEVQRGGKCEDLSNFFPSLQVLRELQKKSQNGAKAKEAKPPFSSALLLLLRLCFGFFFNSFKTSP